MNTFKSQVEKDNGSVFLNPDEFGATHTINGKEVQSVVQNVLTSAEATTGGSVKEIYPGVYGSHVMVNCMKKDMEEMPVYGMVIDLDDHEYMVEQVNDDMGMLTILLVANDR